MLIMKSIQNEHIQKIVKNVEKVTNSQISKNYNNKFLNMSFSRDPKMTNRSLRIYIYYFTHLTYGS